MAAKSQRRPPGKPTSRPKPTAKVKPKSPTAAKRVARSSAPRAKVSAGSSDLLAHMRAICLALPATKEVEAWGHPTFRVADKIFATFGEDAGTASVGVKTTHELQAALVSSDPRFKIAAYVGKHGWVHMALAAPIDWNEVEALVRESYRMIAPAKLAARQ